MLLHICKNCKQLRDTSGMCGSEILSWTRQAGKRMSGQIKRLNHQLQLHASISVGVVCVQLYQLHRLPCSTISEPARTSHSHERLIFAALENFN